MFTEKIALGSTKHIRDKDNLQYTQAPFPEMDIVVDHANVEEGDKLGKPVVHIDQLHLAIQTYAIQQAFRAGATSAGIQKA